MYIFVHKTTIRILEKYNKSSKRRYNKNSICTTKGKRDYERMKTAGNRRKKEVNEIIESGGDGDKEIMKEKKRAREGEIFNRIWNKILKKDMRNNLSALKIIYFKENYLFQTIFC